MTRAKPVTQRALFLAQEGPEHGIFFTSSIADIGSPVRHIIRGNSSSLKKKVEIEKEAMGRAERVRKNKERAKTNPIASSGRSATAVDSSQHNALRQEKILPVVKDLTSVNANERTHAIKAIANLVEDEVCRKLLLREKLVQIIMEQTINDSEAEAVLWGWGALRNLAVEEGYVMCMHMYRKDILTPILVAISKVCRIQSQF